MHTVHVHPGITQNLRGFRGLMAGLRDYIGVNVHLSINCASTYLHLMYKMLDSAITRQVKLVHVDQKNENK